MAAEAAGLLDWLFPGLDPLDQILMLILIVLAGAAVYVVGLAARSARAPRTERRETGKRREQEGGEREKTTRLLLELGIDAVMARAFHRELKRALEQGRVRPALVSDECPQGRVVYDFARGGWTCIEPDGTARPLGSRPAGERLEVEELFSGEEAGSRG